MGVPLYVICYFPLVFNILSVFNFCQLDLSVYVLGCSSLGLSCLELSLDLTISFPMFRKFSAAISSIFSQVLFLSRLLLRPL